MKYIRDFILTSDKFPRYWTLGHYLIVLSGFAHSVFEMFSLQREKVKRKCVGNFMLTNVIVKIVYIYKI